MKESVKLRKENDLLQAKIDEQLEKAWKNWDFSEIARLTCESEKRIK